jgi:plasmid stabilization system protein ParE
VRLELHPEARAELRSAALWHDERRPGLGDEFIAEVSAALDRIGDAPESYPPWPGTRAAGPLIRKATIQRFPYVIAFEKHEQHVLVLAVAHARHRPLYWLTRTNP